MKNYKGLMRVIKYYDITYIYSWLPLNLRIILLWNLHYGDIVKIVPMVFLSQDEALLASAYVGCLTRNLLEWFHSGRGIT